MISLGRKQRQRLSAMLANFAQVAVGALLISNFFKEADWQVRLFAIILTVSSATVAVLVEPEEDND